MNIFNFVTVYHTYNSSSPKPSKNTHSKYLSISTLHRFTKKISCLFCYFSFQYLCVYDFSAGIPQGNIRKKMKLYLSTCIYLLISKLRKNKRLIPKNREKNT